ncbi:MAG: vanadium-dependent haloperoxidase, partial [Blastocatellia bacterium]
AYFNALLILLNLGAPLDAGNPYNTSRTQKGFGTLGDPYIASILCAVAKPALKAVWYQKWFVHRRLRPEAFAGRIHNHVTCAASYPIHPEILNSQALADVFSRNGSYLLPMAFPEGSPTHPSYGAGHATVAGACVTILKAFFDETFVIPNPVEASADGLSLAPYAGPPLTVGGELNKLASNIAIGRNIAGVHWRSDATESLKLGEEVAIRFLREERDCFNEPFNGFSLTRFDGTTITI